MTILETLTSEQKQALIEGAATGIFTTLITDDDPWLNKAGDACAGYYLQHSGNKAMSPFFLSVQALAPDTASAVVGRIVRSKYIEKWTRVYSALVSEYDVLLTEKMTEYTVKSGDKTVTYDNKLTTKGDDTDTIQYNLTEKRTGDNSDNVTYDITETRDRDDTDKTTYDVTVNDTETGKDTTEYNTRNTLSGNDTDNVTYDIDTTKDGNSGNKQTTTRENSIENNLYSFSEDVPVGDTRQNDTLTETVQGSPDDNTIHSLESKEGTEKRTIVKNDTETKTGTETLDTSKTSASSKDGTETREFASDETEAKKGTENRTIGKDETDTKTGTETHTLGKDESATKTGTDSESTTGNVTVTRDGYKNSPIDNIIKELELRRTNVFFNIMYDDIDSMLALQIYV